MWVSKYLYFHKDNINMGNHRFCFMNLRVADIHSPCSSFREAFDADTTLRLVLPSRQRKNSVSQMVSRGHLWQQAIYMYTYHSVTGTCKWTGGGNIISFYTKRGRCHKK